MKGNAQEKKMIDEIVRLVGGTENINTAMHCSTRIRFTLKEEKKADVNALENVEGVLGAQWKAGQLQVIIGQKVGRIYEMMIEQYPMTSGGEVPDDFGEKNEDKKKFSFSAILDFLAGCLAPCLPCILGGGLLKGFISLFVMMKVLTSGSDMHTFLSIISDVPFYFLPFLLANSSAKKFNTDAFMAMAVAGMLMYRPITTMPGHGDHLLGFPVTYAKYSGSCHSDYPVGLGAEICLQGRQQGHSGFFADVVRTDLRVYHHGLCRPGHYRADRLLPVQLCRDGGQLAV